MNSIYSTNDSFPFDKFHLSKPVLVAGGNYFIRAAVENSPLYIQPPKCMMKQGILKATGKKNFYTDLMFTQEDEDFIRWMENLENHCQQHIYKNRETWFDGAMELNDIEDYFNSPLKLYKSGKYYLARVNIHTTLGKPTLKIYDENETEISPETLTEKMQVITILEVQGIKCSARSFQIEMELKQMMIVKPVNLFETCILKPRAPAPVEPGPIVQATEPAVQDTEPTVQSEIEPAVQATEPAVQSEIEPAVQETEPAPQSEVEPVNNEFVNTPDEILEEPLESSDGIQEVEFHLEELPVEDAIQIRQRNDVYYEMYREARRKAKIARDLALAAYLEAKRIKNTYILEDARDSDNSDLEEFEDEEDPAP